MREPRWAQAGMCLLAGLICILTPYIIPALLNNGDGATLAPGPLGESMPGIGRLVGILLLTIAAFLAVISVGAQGTTRARAERAAQATRPTMAQLTETHRKTIGAHEELRDEYATFLHDLDRQLALPGLSDLSVPQTAEFVHALADANDARPAEHKRLTAETVETYAEAVERAQAAWSQAQARAATDAKATERRSAVRSVTEARSAARRILNRILPTEER